LVKGQSKEPLQLVLKTKKKFFFQFFSLQDDLNTSDKISGKNKKEPESQPKEKPAARVGTSRKGIH
jgi:hypothetical protein